MDEKINEALLAFVDFLYAVVFGLIVAKIFEGTLFPEIHAVVKVKSLLLVLAVFYFLLWDWLHGRLLTLRNPFPSYRRFFIEVVIAICGYGAAARALDGKVAFLFYIALILVLGAIWALLTNLDFPKGEDRRELTVIIVLQLAIALIVGAFWVTWEREFGPTINLLQTLILVALGWGAVLIYELAIRRRPGIQAGPGVPFVPLSHLEGIRAVSLRTWKRIWRRQ